MKHVQSARILITEEASLRATINLKFGSKDKLIII